MISLAAAVCGMVMSSNIQMYSYREYKNNKTTIESISSSDVEILSSIEVQDVKITHLLSFFNSVEEPFKVRQYFTENQKTLDLLYEVISHFKDSFDSDTLYSIGILDNSEEDEMPQIYVNAESNKDVDILFGQLDSFYENWWIEKINKAEGKLVFGIS